MATAGDAQLGVGTAPVTPTSGKVSLHSLTGADLQIKNDAGAVQRIVTENFSPGVNLGTATGAAAGTLAYSGQLTAFRSAVAYTGYLFVPLATVLTCPTFNSVTLASGTYVVGGSGDGGVSYTYAYPQTAKALAMKISGRWATANSSSYVAAYANGATIYDAIVIAHAQVNTLTIDGTGIVALDANGRFIISCSVTTLSGCAVTIGGYFI